MEGISGRLVRARSRSVAVRDSQFNGPQSYAVGSIHGRRHPHERYVATPSVDCEPLPAVAVRSPERLR